MRLIIFFDGQFWTGLIERSDEHGFYASQYVFGSEPKDGDIFSFVQHELLNIINSQNTAVTSKSVAEKKINPKRLNKLVRKQMVETPTSTKAQEAIKLEMESCKKEKILLSKEQREEIKEYKRTIAAQKKKQKHKGR